MAEKLPKMTQNSQKNYPKLPITAQKWLKIAKMAQKWPKMAQKLALYIKYSI